MPVDRHIPERLRRLRVVLCHDWLTGMRGGERVLELLCELFPAAPIYTLIHNPAAISETINRHPICTSFLQRMPGIFGVYRNFLPLFPLAIGRLRPPPCDLLISTSHCAAKGIRPPPGARHLCYCFTPMRYVWVFYREYFGTNPVKKIVLTPMLAALRSWDRRSAQRVDRFVAISRHVQARIGAYYGRDSVVVYPPVDTARWQPGPDPAEDFDLIVSALTPYKRIDLAVRAYTRMGRRLKIIGVGSECCRLRALGGKTVELLGWQPDSIILDLYRRCRAVVFPGEEDFGLVPLEAQACGKPVIAYGKGGALETVQDGVSGLFFPRQDEAELILAVEACHGRTWDAKAIRAHVEQFGVEQFVGGLSAAIEQCLNRA